MQRLLDLEVKRFKFNDEYVNNLRAAIAGYKSPDEHEKKLKNVVVAFCLGPEFKRAVREKVGKMQPYTIECCREYFKDNPWRSRIEFGGFFME